LLAELNIRNLAVIPDASIRFEPGLNVITGETGAGKTLLARAIALLLGSRADSGMIRPGEDEAFVEAVFDTEGMTAAVPGLDLIPGEALSVSRRLLPGGRSRAYVCGRGATVAVLRELASGLMAFSAQHEQRSLMMADRQADILDTYAGSEVTDMREEYRLLYEQRLEAAARLEALTQDSRLRQRELELLEFQLAEIKAAGARAGEDGELEREKTMLLKAAELKSAAGALGEALLDGAGGDSVKEQLSRLLPALQESAEIDAGVESIAGRLQDCVFELEDLGREARDYAGAVVDDPQRLQEVEERLELLAQLKRKYGPSLEEVLSYGEAAAVKLETAAACDSDETSLREELDRTEAELVSLALELRQARRKAAVRLEDEAQGHLGELAFDSTLFSISLKQLEGDDALGVDHLTASGADLVEFLVSFNPGMPAAPLADTASGGELSRVMLAVKSAISGSAGAPTLVFDEIDAGIGGETGTAVGQKLKGLAAGSQVICITHLAQIACFADAHFSVIKNSAAASGVTETGVRRLDGEGIVDELCRMMGSDPSDSQARGHAASLLERSASV